MCVNWFFFYYIITYLLIRLISKTMTSCINHFSCRLCQNLLSRDIFKMNLGNPRNFSFMLLYDMKLWTWQAYFTSKKLLFIFIKADVQIKDVFARPLERVLRSNLILWVSYFVIASRINSSWKIFFFRMINPYQIMNTRSWSRRK